MSNQTLKNKARERDNNTCQKCGFHDDEMNLDIHHIKPLHKKGDDILDNMITLCPFCHCISLIYDIMHDFDIEEYNYKKISRSRR